MDLIKHIINSLCFLLVLLIPSTALTQVLRGKISSEGQPLGMANVIMYAEGDSIKPAVFATSDTAGYFEATVPAPGLYDLRIQLIGFVPYRQLLNVEGDIDLGNINMPLENNMLQEVTITARKKMIQRTGTGLIVQTDQVLTQAAGTATDLLANVPTVLVNADGGVSIRGQSPVILINGRNSNLGNNLDRIPASSIERIEIINNPGARYDADAEGGVINIILKKNTLRGTNGAFAIGGGYGARERSNSSFILNRRDGNTNLGISYDNRIGRRTRDINTDRVNFMSDNNYMIGQRRSDERKEITHNVKLNGDFTTRRKDVFSVEGIYGYDNDWNYETLKSRIDDKTGGFTSGNTRISDERQKENNWEGSLNYLRKFAESRRLFSAGISHSYGNEVENTLINTSPANEKGDITGDPYWQRTKNKEITNITNLRLDMGWPVSPRATLEAGYKGIIRQVTTDFVNAYQQNGEFIRDPVFSNDFDFGEHIHAVYGTYRSSWGADEQWKYEVGLRLEQMMNEGESNKTAATFTNSFFNFFPALNLSRKFEDGNMVKFNLGRRINRPWLGRLNPFIDITDSLNQYGGNPRLRPELVNTLELGWGKDWDRLSLSSNIFYRRGSNTILPYTELRSNGITFTQPRNIGSSRTMGVESFVTYEGARIWNSTASISLFDQKVQGDVDGDELNSDVFSWYVKWVNNFNVTGSTKAQLLLNYEAPTAIPQGTRVASYNVDFGLQQKLFKGKGRLGLTVTDIFNTLQYGQTINAEGFSLRRRSKADTRAVLLTFAMTFGSAFKEKLMENQFSQE